MYLIRMVERRGDRWTLRDNATGKVYTLTGADLPDRLDGLQARVTGQLEDSFGLGVLHNDAVLRVQRWNVV